LRKILDDISFKVRLEMGDDYWSELRSMVFAFHPGRIGDGASFVWDAICASRRHLAQHLSQLEEIFHRPVKLQSIPPTPSKTIGESREA